MVAAHLSAAHIVRVTITKAVLHVRTYCLVCTAWYVRT